MQYVSLRQKKTKTPIKYETQNLKCFLQQAMRHVAFKLDELLNWIHICHFLLNEKNFSQAENLQFLHANCLQQTAGEPDCLQCIWPQTKQSEDTHQPLKIY